MRARGYLVERYDDMAGAYTTRRLVEEADERGIDLRVVGVLDMQVVDGALRHGDEALKPRDFVINRYKWGHLKRELGRLAPRAYNSPVPFERFVDKYEQLVSIRSEAFTIPRWVLGTPGQGFERMASLLGVPFVAKGLASSQGAEVELISSEADMGFLASRFGADRELVFEEFVSSSAGRDLRLFAVRGLPLACMERRSERDFRANVALGAEVSARRVDDALECVARDVYEQTGLDFVGIDLLYGEGGYVFCEINVMPGISGMEAATGVNVAGAMVDVIGGDLR